MLLGFREGVREGTYQGKHLMHIAQGLMLLDQLINQSQGQLDRAKILEKEAYKRSQEMIRQAGGQVKEPANAGSESPVN